MKHVFNKLAAKTAKDIAIKLLITIVSGLLITRIDSLLPKLVN